MGKRLQSAAVPLPRTAIVSVLIAGFPLWTPRVVLDAARCCVSLLATDENLAMLLAFVGAAPAEPVEPMHRGETLATVGDCIPRGPSGSREYFHKSKGVWIRLRRSDSTSLTSDAASPASGSGLGSLSDEAADRRVDVRRYPKYLSKILRPGREAVERPPRAAKRRRGCAAALPRPEQQTIGDCLD